MSAAVAAMVAPLVWPPPSDAGGRWLPRVLGALEVELDACWRACELAVGMDETPDSEPLAERLREVVSAAVVRHDSSDVVALLEAHAPDAAAHLHAAGASHRRALGALRDVVWLAQQRLLDRSRLPSVISEAIADLAAAGRAIAAADRALLEGLGFAEAAQRRE